MKMKVFSWNDETSNTTKIITKFFSALKKLVRAYTSWKIYVVICIKSENIRTIIAPKWFACREKLLWSIKVIDIYINKFYSDDGSCFLYRWAWV